VFLRNDVNFCQAEGHTILDDSSPRFMGVVLEVYLTCCMLQNCVFVERKCSEVGQSYHSANVYVIGNHGQHSITKARQ
jgi:hypothetical protein